MWFPNLIECTKCKDLDSHFVSIQNCMFYEIVDTFLSKGQKVLKAKAQQEKEMQLSRTKIMHLKTFLLEQLTTIIGGEIS